MNDSTKQEIIAAASSGRRVLVLASDTDNVRAAQRELSTAAPSKVSRIIHTNGREAIVLGGTAEIRFMQTNPVRLRGITADTVVLYGDAEDADPTVLGRAGVIIAGSPTGAILRAEAAS